MITDGRGFIEKIQDQIEDEIIGRICMPLDRPIDKLLIVDANIAFDLTTPEIVYAQVVTRCDLLIVAPFRAYSGWLAEAQAALVQQGMHLDRLHLLCFRRDEAVESRLMRLYTWLERWAPHATTLAISGSDAMERAGVRVLAWEKAQMRPDKVGSIISDCLADPRLGVTWWPPVAIAPSQGVPEPEPEEVWMEDGSGEDGSGEDGSGEDGSGEDGEP